MRQASIGAEFVRSQVVAPCGAAAFDSEFRDYDFRHYQSRPYSQRDHEIQVALINSARREIARRNSGRCGRRACVLGCNARHTGRGGSGLIFLALAGARAVGDLT